MPWYKITPANEQASRNIEDAFEAAFASAASVDWRAIKNAAMYATKDKLAIRNPSSLYFSPDTAVFFSAQLAAFGATECDRPNRDEVSPHIGQGNFDSNLFIA